MTSTKNARAAATNSLPFKKSAMNHWLAAALCGFGVLAGTAAQAAPVTVAIINGSSGIMDVGSLAAQLNDDSFHDFSATVLLDNAVTNASVLSSYNVVLLGGSGHSNSEYSANTLAAVHSFMQAGGGVVTAGWYRYGAIGAADQAAADAITPVVTGGDYAYAYDTSINFNNILHDITSGVSSFSVSGCCIEVASALDLGATSLATADGSIAVAYQDTVGRSVYLGALYTANPGSYNVDGLRTGDADRLLEQSVYWAANRSTVVPNANSDVPEPGSLALVMAAVAALAIARRSA